MSLLKNKKAVLAAAAILSIVGLIWFAVAHWPHPADVEANWPTKSQTHTLLLRPATSLESTRLVDYASDHTTVTGMRIEYRDGRTALVSYKDGQPTTISTYFAEKQDTASADPADSTKKLVALRTLSDGLDKRTLQTTIVFKDDGKTIKALTTYNENGSYAAIGVRDANDDFAVTMYGTGASGVSGIAVYSGTDGKLRSEQEFREDGSVASSFTTENINWAKGRQTFFDENGSKTKQIDFNSDYDIQITEFGADGKTVVRKTQFGWSGMTVTDYNAAGTPVLERQYYSESRIYVRYFDDKGTATMKQIWTKLDTTEVAADQVGVTSDGYYLNEVYEYHSDGSSTKVDVTFYPGGKTIKEYETRPTTSYRPSTTQHFRDDGSLDYTETCPYDGSGSWVPCTTTRMPDGPNKVRAKVNQSWYKVTPLLPAPSADKPAFPVMPLTIDLN